MAAQGEDVYATLLLNDSYLPGALVLAHSLRDAGTSKKLAVLVTSDSISPSALNELYKLFDYVIPVERIANGNLENLQLLGRADLHSTFTKIVLWKQLQFRRVVYLDADMVALRAPDELFALPQPFSAAPDIGWPDIFNTGLMVLNPNMGDYFALLAMAQRGISFDGADQGLLNMHFKNTFNRLSFTYNVTPSAHYQYLPAYRHFQSSISVAHFIGPHKPWTQGRDASRGPSPYNDLIGRWWAVYDKHFRESSVDSSAEGLTPAVQNQTKGESHPVHPVVPSDQQYQPATLGSEIIHPATEEAFHESEEIPKQVEEAHVLPAEADLEPEHQEQAEPIFSAWDGQYAPPPQDSRPEASNFPAIHYDMSSDLTPFKAPERYPDPPQDMYYEVPKTPTYQKPVPIFPWEKDSPNPARVFPDDEEEPKETPSSDMSTAAPSGDEKAPVTPTSPTFQTTAADPWQSYARGNAWDDIPEIEQYIGKLQKNRKGNIQLLQGYGAGIEQASSPGAIGRRSMKLTDFPTELERPSLPVTPAPIRRPSFWGEERDEEGELPAAEGVPSQEEWNPAEQLEQLARRQSDVLANKLGSQEESAREIPMRPLPCGSEGVTSPTYVAQAPKTSATTALTEPTLNVNTTTKPESRPTITIQEPSYQGSMPSIEKAETSPTHETPLAPSEEEKDVLET